MDIATKLPIAGREIIRIHAFFVRANREVILLTTRVVISR